MKIPFKQIVVTGSLAFDIIMNFKGKFSDHILPDKIHTINLSFGVDEMSKTRGGTAGNIAYNLGLLQCRPILLSTFGKDGARYRNFLLKNGVDVSLSPLSKKLYTSQSLVLTDSADNQITSFYGGSMVENKSLRILSVIASTEPSRSAKQSSDKKIATSPTAPRNDKMFVIISPNTSEAMRNFVKECASSKIPFMYDPGMQLPRTSDADLKFGIGNCEILIGNDYEIELMKKRGGDLRRPPILVTTLGEKGAIIFDHHVGVSHGKPLQYVINSARPKSIVDPTGAGDAFRAGFLAGYVRNFDLKTCGQMGATCAVYTIEKYGTTTHKFSINSFCKRYQENYGVKLTL